MNKLDNEEMLKDERAFQDYVNSLRNLASFPKFENVIFHCTTKQLSIHFSPS